MKLGNFVLILLAVFSVNQALAIVLPNRSYNEQMQLEKFKYQLLKKNQKDFSFFGFGSSGVDETHVQFANTQEAIDWMAKVSPRLSASMGAERFNVLPASDARYAALQSKVHQIWLGFQDLFPSQTSGLNEPPVIVVDSEVENAFVPRYILVDNKIAHTIVILTGLLDSTGGIENVDAFAGVIAHEIAHSVFRHGLTEYAQKINKYYDPAQFKFGYAAPRNEELNNTIDTWAQAAFFAGDLTFVELNNLPSKGLSRPLMLRAFKQMVEDYFDNNSICLAAKESAGTWSSLQKGDQFLSAYVVNPADLAALSTASSSLTANAANCLQGKPVKFVTVLAKVLGMEESVLANIPDFQQLDQQFNSAANPIAGLQNIVTPFRQLMVQIEAAIPLNKTAYYTYEEHADDISLQVLQNLGWNTRSLADFFQKIMSPENIKRCDSIINSGQLPPNGAFSDPHRSDCYRVSHLIELEKAVKATEIHKFASDYVQASGSFK